MPQTLCLVSNVRALDGAISPIKGSPSRVIGRKQAYLASTGCARARVALVVHPIVGMTNSASARMPVGQRVVMVFSRV